MADLTCDCAEELDMIQFPCKAVDYGYPSKLLLLPLGGDITVAGESPTLAEVQAAMAASGLDKMILIEEITNGQRVEVNREEESGADTSDGLVDTFSINMAITGRVKLINEAIRSKLAGLNCHKRLKVWFITNKGYIFGGKTGYKAANFIPPMSLEGFGTRGYYPLNYVYAHDLTKDDPAGQNDGFLDLVNVDVS